MPELRWHRQALPERRQRLGLAGTTMGSSVFASQRRQLRRERRRGQIFTFDILEDDRPVDEHAPELSPVRVPATQYHTQPRATASSVSCPQSPPEPGAQDPDERRPEKETEGLLPLPATCIMISWTR